jgi:hypothetical protein
MNGRRREFLADVGRGMLVASLGATASLELGIVRGFADEPTKRLTFGTLEPLVTLMQETPPDQLMPLLAERLAAGVELKTLVCAGALGNARAFGGQDYTGFHTFMALAPALQIADELSVDRRPLPVMKVLYRNSSRIQDQAADHHDVLTPIDAGTSGPSPGPGELRASIRAIDWNLAENQFARLSNESVARAYDQLQAAIQDEPDVHRVVLSWRAWVMFGLAGQEYAQTLLRQSVRYCLDTEQRMREKNYPHSGVRELLPRLLDEHRLLAKPLGDRPVDDKWVEQLAREIFAGTQAEAATAVAVALAEGIDPDAIGQALSLAANSLVLHDPGRRPEQTSPGKPAGCVHGDSPGVHASDAANAWRNIARVANERNRVASYIVGAYHTGGQMRYVSSERFPYADKLEELGGATSGAALLAETEQAIRANDQALACALVDRYCQLQLPAAAVFDLMRKYAVSEDGALHAEKYFRTVTEEYAATRPAFRARQLVALARVTASEYGYPAPGYQQACELLRVS